MSQGCVSDRRPFFPYLEMSYGQSKFLSLRVFSHNTTSRIKLITQHTTNIGILTGKIKKHGAKYFFSILCKEVSPIMSIQATAKRPTLEITGKWKAESTGEVSSWKVRT